MSTGTITLSTHDADWIASVARERLKEIDEDFSEAMEAFNNATDKAEKYLELATSNEEEKKDYFRVKNETLEKVTSEYHRDKEQLEKIILLMMTGSENTDDNYY